jgi:hypothetical protein
MANKLKVTILSFACCDPKFAQYERRYADLIKEVLAKNNWEADLELVTGTDALMSMQYAYMAPIRPLFQKYGSAITPALFINEVLALFGGVPMKEKLTEVLKKAMTDPPVKTQD